MKALALSRENVEGLGCRLKAGETAALQAPDERPAPGMGLVVAGAGLVVEHHASKWNRADRAEVWGKVRHDPPPLGLRGRGLLAPNGNENGSFTFRGLLDFFLAMVSGLLSASG